MRPGELRPNSRPSGNLLRCRLALRRLLGSVAVGGQELMGFTQDWLYSGRWGSERSCGKALPGHYLLTVEGTLLPS